MRILVTGGAGFLGAHFVRAVLADRLPGLAGAEVTVLDKLTYASGFGALGPVAENGRFDFVPGDVADAPVTGHALRGHDAVVHFAAETDVARSARDGAAFAAANVVGTQVLLDAAVRRGTERFLHVSTGRVYGPVGPEQPAEEHTGGQRAGEEKAGGEHSGGERAGEAGGPRTNHADEDLTDGAWTESAALAPDSAYAASKAGADLAVLACHRTHGLPVVVTRACDVFGPGQHPEKLIPSMITHLLEGRTVPLPGGGASVREWLAVDDHSAAVAAALTQGRPGEVYNVAGSVELSDRDLAAAILQASDDSGADRQGGWDRMVTVPPVPGDTGRWALDDTKLRRDLGWRPHVEFDPALAATVRWYRANPDRWRPFLFD